MKPLTFALAFGPAILVLLVKFVLDPTALSEWSISACAGLGVAIGALAGAAAHVVDPSA